MAAAGVLVVQHQPGLVLPHGFGVFLFHGQDFGQVVVRNGNGNAVVPGLIDGQCLAQLGFGQGQLPA